MERLRARASGQATGLRFRSRLIQRRDRGWPAYLPCPAAATAALKPKLFELRRVAGTTSRRNHLLASAAVIYSLTGIAKLNGVASKAWLHYVFEPNANHPINRVDEILLWHCAKQLAPAEEHAVSQRCSDIIKEIAIQFKALR
ncbi:transposase domain-containing protein [Janthinobacterium sp. SUN137]|uniref:transposase domain-containing protein n=1 Tax=Janthinobacterium sp. SUN137 TaxID=3014789 RepID=UPI0027123D1B|nr:transposase domain-containing protein [Janthinobacterium sp. SUN137]MDO8040353.1 transposase domain-containing protein [Janthinobacterium sp. SUN137]